MAQQGRAGIGCSRQAGFVAGWPAYVVTVVVACAAAYSFSPRVYPPAPVTQVQSGSRGSGSRRGGRRRGSGLLHDPYRRCPGAHGRRE